MALPLYTPRAGTLGVLTGSLPLFEPLLQCRNSKGSNWYQRHFVSLEGNTTLPLPLGNLNEFILIANSER